MAGEYDINLSNGTILATLYPLEVNGPDNISTPRQIQVINATANEFEIVGDMTGRFVAGFQFTVQNSGGADGTYTVDAAGSTYSAVSERTTIPVTTAIASEALPYGDLRYTVLDARTTISLPGRGTINWGEFFIDNAVHILENFAADDSPDTNVNLGTAPFGQPLTGQWWYNTTVGQEGFKYFDGTSWTSNYDMDNGVLIFRDPQNTVVPNTDIMLTADETSLIPYGYTSTAEAGMVIWTKDNPADSEPILRVLSEGGSERLRVEHGGTTSTTNNLEVLAQTIADNISHVDGALTVGGIPGTSTARAVADRSLTVQGNGIAVNSDLATSAALKLNAPVGMISYIDFMQGNALKGNIAVNDAVAGDPLELNSAVANDIVAVLGGGNVGINEVAPSRRLDVVGESEFNGDVYVVSSDIIFDNGFGLESVAGGLLKTGAGGKTWQAFPADNAAAGFVVNDSLSAGVLQVDETTGTQVLQYNFLVDTDTLFVDALNDRVGVNIVPLRSFDVAGTDARMSLVSNIDIISTAADVNLTAADNVNISATNGSTVTGTAQFNNPVGINNAPPSGSPVWLEVTGDIQANSQFRGSNQAQTNPTYSFSNSTTSGMFFIPATNSVAIATAGVERWRVDSTGQTLSVDTTINGNLTVTGQTRGSNGSAAAPSISFANQTDTGMYFFTDVFPRDESIGFATSGVERLVISDIDTKVVGNFLVQSTSQFNDAVTVAAEMTITDKLWMTNPGVVFNIDSDLAADGNAVKRITTNDGNGNFNIRHGVYWEAGSPSGLKYANATDGGASISLDAEAATSSLGSIRMQTWALNTGAAGDNVGTEQSMFWLNDRLRVDVGGVQRFVIEPSGTLTVGNTPNYETLVIADDDIPNKKYVDDLVKEQHTALGTVSSGTATINVASGVNTDFSLTVGGAITVAITNPPASGTVATFTLELINAGSNVTWPASVVWPGGTEPSWSATGTDLVVFRTRNGGTTWFASEAGIGYA